MRKPLLIHPFPNNESIKRFSSLQPIVEQLNESRSWTPYLVTSLITALSTSRSPTNALLVFRIGRRKGFKPDNHTYPYLFKACASAGATIEGKLTHGDAIKNGFVRNVYVGNSLIRFYGSCCGDITSAHKLFNEMPHRTVVSWNSMIGAFAVNSCTADAIAVFAKMWVHRYEPDETTFVALLSACSHLGNMTLGQWIHCKVIEKGLDMNCHLGTALVNMYAKCGNLRYARLLFDKMKVRNVWTWSAMIIGLAQHGFASKAIDLFMEMEEKSIKPNGVTFLGLLCACSHSGLVKQGYRYFDEMIQVHGFKPMLSHYGVMVDMLGRAGKLSEAYRFVLDMDIEPDAVVWRTLLTACNVHNNDGDDQNGIGKKVMKKLLELEPDRCGNKVMVSNKYAEFEMWEEAEALRGGGDWTKMAGESSVEIGGIVHRFVSGDGVFLGHDRLYQLLEELNLHMKKLILDLQD